MLMFLDFEASSLSDRSWSIEIGLAWLDADGLVASVGRLIRPDAAWAMEDGAEDSAIVHGIARADLDAASPATEVAVWAKQIIGTFVLVSDAQRYDQAWLARLMATAGLDAPEVADLDAVAARAFTGTTMEEDVPLRAFYRALDRAAHPHRAEADARGLAEAWAEGLQAKALGSGTGTTRAGPASL